MKRHAIKNVFVILLLLMATAILAVGCYPAGPPPPPGYADYGYYEGYSPGFFESDVIIDVDKHREGERHEGHFEGRPDVSHMPARRLPPPAPRPVPPSRPAPHMRR
jgi:hypothetical protein